MQVFLPIHIPMAKADVAQLSSGKATDAMDALRELLPLTC